MSRRCVALVAIVVCVACSKHDPPAAPREARRVVSLSPATTEALFAIGAGDRVVGRTRFCDWPPEALKLPAVGGFVDADVEAILERGPDLVVGARGPSAARVEDKLAARGIATWFPAAESIAAVNDLIAGLGQRTGRADDARRTVEAMRTRLESIDRALSGEARVRVLVVVGLAPIVAAGPGSFLSEMIAHAAATNAVGDGGSWPVLGFERVVEIDPEIVVDASAGESGGATRIHADSAGWSGVRAVQEGRVVPMGDERVLRPGPRLAEGVAALARALHPRAAIP